MITKITKTDLRHRQVERDPDPCVEHGEHDTDVPAHRQTEPGSWPCCSRCNPQESEASRKTFFELIRNKHYFSKCNKYLRNISFQIYKEIEFNDSLKL